MIYALSIDWLSIFCLYACDGEWSPVNTDFFAYKKETFGTRVFSEFYRVRVPNDEGGVDEFAEIQAKPYSSILPAYAVIVRFVNRTLYLPNFWELADRLLVENYFSCAGISRIDICADFNQFATIPARTLIEQFAAKKLRHIGRGTGALYFNHGTGVERDEFNRPVNDYGVRYTGLSFGTHASGAHVYLYNKTEELLTQGDKPWIKDLWKNVGLDKREVWRLEVSIKSEGLKFKDKKTGNKIEIDVPLVMDNAGLDKIFHTFQKKLFSFIRNKEHISNITREPRLVLFDDRPAYDRGVIRNLSAGNRMERILIKQLWQLGDTYRGAYIYGAKETARDFAEKLAASTGLHYWLQDKKEEWETPVHK